ncbi:DNA-binding protein YbiB [Niveibacterium terrae]|uniref:DNA-binding protein YbiB n=1 Tax=Niveibacterium terrae TaxID=3373598 RepID=UPI003A8D1193
MSYAPIIKEIGRGAKGARAMTQEQAEALFGDILDGKVPELELGAILLSLRIKGEDVDELAGFQRALAARTPQLRVPDGPRCVLLPTYNGARRQANLMPLVAQLLAREGIPVLIHGFHDFADRLDPFGLLAELGLTPEQTREDAERALGRERIACLHLATLSPQLAALLALRPRLGVRNVGHTLVKLLDSCRGRSVRVLPMTHPETMERTASLLGREQAWALLMRGSEGEAYALPRRRPRLLGFFNGEARELFPAEDGDPAREVREAVSNPANAALIRAMLAGDEPIPQPILDQISALSTLARA